MNTPRHSRRIRNSGAVARSRLTPLIAAAVVLAGPVAAATAQYRLNARSQNPNLRSRDTGHVVRKSDMPKKQVDRPGMVGIHNRRHGARHGIFLRGHDFFTRAKFTPFGTRILVADGFVYPYDYFPPLVGVERKIDPNLTAPAPGPAAAEPEAEPEPNQIGIALLRSGRYNDAVDAFAAAGRDERRAADEDGPQADDHPDAGEDPWAKRNAARLQALAMVGAGRVGDAAGLVLDLYRESPYLATMPLSGEAVFKSGLEMRRLVTRAVRNAHREESPRAWLLVAVLMQAESRDELAAKMLDRAADLGLDEGVVQAWPGASAGG